MPKIPGWTKTKENKNTIVYERGIKGGVSSDKLISVMEQPGQGDKKWWVYSPEWVKSVKFRTKEEALNFAIAYMKNHSLETERHPKYKKLFEYDEISEKWRAGKGEIIYNKKRYIPLRLSCGEFFLEPVGWRGGETEGFAPGTIWLSKVPIKNRYGATQMMFAIE